MQGMPEEVKNQIKATFDKIDANHDGKISKSEIQAIVGMVKCGWTEADYTELFKDVDPVGQTLTFEQMITTKSSQMQLLLAFLMIDLNADGKISFEEMKAVVQRSGQAIPPDPVLRQMFDTMDTNKDGFISFVEFKDSMFVRVPGGH